ncbi:hypothetical protein TESG_08525 [Trichophyton tonsurans CBS 112818]|uniref:Uncharacterized protein n=1 Tax=Trichophyton tonsurans (strain CBS 112818) TaxID=647933 RepID=F2S3B5_TRIT1|nr:hypothetical protein TESG_08525 [Trichophyton tonsurans CBS 112818]
MALLACALSLVAFWWCISSAQRVSSGDREDGISPHLPGTWDGRASSRGRWLPANLGRRRQQASIVDVAQQIRSDPRIDFWLVSLLYIYWIMLIDPS